MDPVTINYLISVGVGLVFGWLARHKGLGPFIPTPPSTPSAPVPISLPNHPLMQTLLNEVQAQFLKWLQSQQPPAPPKA